MFGVLAVGIWAGGEPVRPGLIVAGAWCIVLLWRRRRVPRARRASLIRSISDWATEPGEPCAGCGKQMGPDTKRCPFCGRKQ